MNKELRGGKESSVTAIHKNIQNLLRESGWNLAIGPLAVIFVIVFFCWLTSEVLEGETAAFDNAIRETIHQISSSSLTTVMIFFTRLGSWWGIAPLLIFASTIFVRWRQFRAAIILWMTMTGEIVLNFILKDSLQRVRPASFFDFPLPESFSYPSGHAFAALCFFGVVAWLVTNKINGIATRIVIWLIAIFLTLIIGISRIYLGVHYPSDVLAGYIAGLIWLAAILLGARFQKEKSASG